MNLANIFTDLFAYITQLMTTYAAIFEALGGQLYAAFTVIVVAWFGVEWALKGSLSMDRFARMMLSISFGFAMSRYYSTPIPGFGVSFYHLIVDQGTVLANQLNARMVSNVMGKLDQVYWSIEAPSLSAIINVVSFFHWGITVLAVFAASVASFLVISFGYVAVAVCAILGPVFIPFFILPKMEWLFWGWLRALLQYAFYPVVANAYVFVMGSLLVNFIDRAGMDLSGPRLAALFFPLLFVLISYCYGLLKIPSLVNSMFTGKAGESALPF